MAMEIKTLEVKNDEEQSAIEFWSQFGWQLKSSQRIFNKDSHLEKRGDSVYSVTETVDFTKLVFERDKNGANYARIVALEDEFLTIRDNTPEARPSSDAIYSTWEEWARAKKPDARSKAQKILFFVMLIGGIALVLLLERFNSPITIALQILGVVSIIASFIVKSVIKKTALNKALNGENEKGVAKLKEGFAEYENKLGQDLEKVRAYDQNIRRMRDILSELDKLI